MWVHIRAICTGHSLFVDIYYNIHWFCKPATKALISLCVCDFLTVNHLSIIHSCSREYFDIFFPEKIHVLSFGISCESSGSCVVFFSGVNMPCRSIQRLKQ